MRRLPYVRSFVAVLLLAVFTISVAAGPREDRPIREPRDPITRIVKIVKKVIRSFGDGLTTPTP